LSADEIDENVDLRCVPNPVMTGMMATAIPAAISSYSIAVAPFSSFKNLMSGRTRLATGAGGYADVPRYNAD
jgi:hypothetical protein